MSDTFVIEGLSGKKILRGSVAVYGAKNNALKLMAAAALVSGTSTFENVPPIADVAALAKLLEGVGAYVSRDGTHLSIDASAVSGTVLEASVAKSLRASIVLAGPLLARLGSVTFPHPGGDIIGERPIDIFISGFKTLGAVHEEANGSHRLTASAGLSGGEIFMRVVSVTATETFMMAATLARGPVTLRNCAMEPEIPALAEFLRSCGARVTGDGTPTIYIEPAALSAPQKPFRVIPDRIEAATFLALGALAAQDLTITGAEPAHLGAVFDALTRMGVSFSVSQERITISAPERLLPIPLRTHEYPGFPTDAQAPFTVALTQAEGESSVIESIFDGRLAYTKELVRMGASITAVSPHRVNVTGRTPLSGAAIDTPDIRAGLAFILAAAIAEGTSKVGNAHLIDRGYAAIETRLSALGLSIQRA